jgi:hypothetical protein
MTEKRWRGTPPERCDLCHRLLTWAFVDGKTQFGIWGIMCPECHIDVGVGLGVGRGQRYELPSLRKVDG